MNYDNLTYIIIPAFIVILIIRKIKKDPIGAAFLVLKILKVLRWILTGIVGFIYFIFPFDIIPDIIVPFGWIDDIGVILLAHTVFKIITFADKIERIKQRLEDKLRFK